MVFQRKPVYHLPMKTFLSLLVFSTLALADWSTRETALLRVTPFPSPARIPAALGNLAPANADKLPKGMVLIVQPRPGITIEEGSEYRVTVRYRGLDGKIRTVTRNLTPDDKRNARTLVPCDIDEPLTVTGEVVAPGHTEEAQ